MSIALFVLILAQDSVSLRWKFAAGDEFELKAVSKTASQTTVKEHNGGETKESESETQTLDYLVTVTEVADSGEATLVFRINGLDHSTKSSQNDISFKATRLQSGEIEIQSSIKINGEEFAPVKKFLDQFIKNLMDVRLIARIDPRGRSSHVKVEGDLFKDLPNDSTEARVMRRMLEGLLQPKDLASDISSFILRLPDKVVKPGGAWNVDETIDVMGMKAKFSGEAKLETVLAGVAAVQQSGTMEVDPSEFSKRLTETLEAVFKEAGVEMKIQCALKVKDKVAIDSTHSFSVSGGHSLSESWPSVKMVLEGDMTISDPAGQDQNKSHMTIEVTVDSSLTWSKRKK